MSLHFTKEETDSEVMDKIQKAYGPDPDLKFRATARKLRISTSDVKQTAAVVYFENVFRYDRTRKENKFYWGNLLKRLLRDSIGPQKYAVSLNDESSFGIQACHFVESISIENNERPDWKVDEISKIPELLELYKYADSISGKSVQQIAAQEGLSVRRINQKLQEKIKRAIELRKQIK